MRIMVFLHGTTITEENGVDLPILNAAKKIQTWKERGAEIVYLTHRRRPEDVRKETLMLTRHGFPGGPIYHRKMDANYSEVAARVLPDVLEATRSALADRNSSKFADYIFVSSDVEVRGFRTVDSGASDHLALCLDFEFDDDQAFD